MERLTRPLSGASFQERSRFGAQIIAALKRLDVQPGDDFVIRALPTQAHTRTGDPATSREAAKSVEDLTAAQTDVLKMFGSDGMTDEELVNQYRVAAAGKQVKPQADSGIRSRRDNLVDLGFIYDTGNKRQLQSGRMGIVWARRSDPEPKIEPDPGPWSTEPSSLFADPAAEMYRRPSMFDPE